MNIVFEYIKYRLNAKTRHGIHSPFVYDLLDKCMRTSLDKDDKSTIQQISKRYKNDHRIIEVQDFGLGSKKLGNSRKISSIFKISSSKGKYAKLFYQLAKYYNPSRVLEFGTSLGIGTIHFALGAKKSKILTIEACSNTFETSGRTFSEFNLQNIETINSTFQDLIDSGGLDSNFDIIFIDGHHDGPAMESYLNQLEPFISDETIIILDDIRWSDSMLSSWNKLVNSENFHVSLDLFRMGILVKRKHQEKEHFVIRLK